MLTSLLPLIALSSVLLLAIADDPASSWLVYAIAPGNGTRVTQVNATWVVPSYPKDRNAPNAPGYWFGIEPRPADLLIQPILGNWTVGDRCTLLNFSSTQYSLRRWRTVMDNL